MLTGQIPFKTGFVVQIGNNVVNWEAVKQKTLALSSIIEE